MCWTGYSPLELHQTMFLSCIQPNRTKQWCVWMFNIMQLDSWRKAGDHPWTKQSIKENAAIIEHSKCCVILTDHLPLAEEPVWFVSGFSFQGREVVNMSLRALAVDMYRCSVSQTVQSKGPVRPAAAKICSFGELWHPNWCCRPVANHVDVWGKGNGGENRKLL